MAEAKIALFLTPIESAVLDAALRQYSPSDPSDDAIVQELLIVLERVR